MSELMTKTLAGVFPGHKDRLYYLQEKVEADFFSGPHKDLWEVINRVALMTGGEVATKKTVTTALDRAIDLPIERRASIEDTFTEVLNYGEVSEVDFRTSVSYLEEDYRKSKLGEGMSSAMEVLTRGIRKGNDTIFGVDPALEELHMAIAEVERIGHGVMPEGSIYDEQALLMKELESNEAMMRIATGIRPLDDLTFGGAGAGELWLIAAYAGVGKTFFCTNLGYNFAFGEGANVVYLTAETLREQVLRRLLVRHTHDPKFNLPNGLTSSALKKHTPENPILTPQQIQQWHNVINDFSTRQEGRGEFHIAQIPMNAKISTIHAKLNKINNAFPIDIAIIDSLDLLSPEVKRAARREELNDILTSAKHLGTAFDNGRGLRVISPWQTSREAWKKARETGRYDKSSMAETAEAERKADLILGLLEDPQNEYKLKGQTLKFRDSTPKDFEVSIDYDRGWVGSNDRAGAVQETDMLEASGFADL